MRSTARARAGAASRADGADAREEARGRELGFERVDRARRARARAVAGAGAGEDGAVVNEGY